MTRCARWRLERTLGLAVCRGYPSCDVPMRTGVGCARARSARSCLARLLGVRQPCRKDRCPWMQPTRDAPDSAQGLRRGGPGGHDARTTPAIATSRHPVPLGLPLERPAHRCCSPELGRRYTIVSSARALQPFPAMLPRTDGTSPPRQRPLSLPFSNLRRHAACLTCARSDAPSRSPNPRIICNVERAPNRAAPLCSDNPRRMLDSMPSQSRRAAPSSRAGLCGRGPQNKIPPRRPRWHGQLGPPLTRDADSIRDIAIDPGATRVPDGS